MWEGIGISSYLLINFWFTRIQANKSAIKALVVNRVGDMFLSVAFFALFFVFGNLDYSTIFSIAPFINETIITIIGLLLLLAAMGKSAQLGLHTWLPDQPTFYFISNYASLIYFQYVSLFSNFAPKDEQGPSPKSIAKRHSRSINDFLFSFLIGLIVSGNLLSRTHKENITARLVYQTNQNHPQAWYDFILELLEPFCAKGWDRKENKDSRDGSIGIRMILSTLTYPCFYVIHTMFFSNGSGERVFTKEMLMKFNVISLAALIMSSGYILEYGAIGNHYNLVFYERFKIKVNWWESGLALHLPYHCTREEMLLLQNRLSELGINTVIALSRVRRMRAGPRILIPFDEFENLQNIVGEYIIEEKKHLIKRK